VRGIELAIPGSAVECFTTEPYSLAACIPTERISYGESGSCLEPIIIELIVVVHKSTGECNKISGSLLCLIVEMSTLLVRHAL